MLGLASCQNDPEGFDVTVDGEVSTKVTVNLADDSGTRATAGTDSTKSGLTNLNIADNDKYTIRYILRVFDVNETAKVFDPVYTDEKTVSFDVRLVPGRDYNFVVWADIVSEDNPGDLHYNTEYFPIVTLNNTWTAMDETRDAFTCVETVTGFNATTPINITLTRPFAKLRVVTNDLAELFGDNKQPTTATVKYTTAHYNAFNALEGKVIGDSKNRDIKHEDYIIKSYGDNVENQSMVLFTDYFFAKTEQEAIQFTLSVVDGNNNPMRTTYFNTDIPVKRNYLTTITGNVLTDGNKVNVEIEDEFGNSENPNDPPFYIELWDGESIDEPSVSADGNIYEIERPSELAWLAAAVNGTLTEDYTRSAVAANDFEGKTFILTENIDLDNKPWTPIGDANNHIFKGTFNGNGKIIKNLVVNGNKNQGLFGKTGGNARFENVVIENAKVSGRLNVGALVGEPEGATAENIQLLGHVEVNGFAYVGGVAGKHVTADWNNITVDVDETSYVKAHSIENGTAYRSYVGGVVGFMQAHKHKLSNVTSNINVKGSTCDVGGIVGIAHYNNKYENIVCTGNVEIYAAEEAADAQKIGGIAGTWYNGVDYKKQPVTVTMTNCSFEGNLTTNIENVKFYYDGLVGKYYDANDNTGKLIIDGKQYVASVVELQAAVNAATGETTLYLGYDIVGDVTVVQNQGVKITIEGEDKKFNGSIKVHSNSNYYADAALTIKNVNFETSNASVNVIEALENGSERYSQNITVENCTFTATGEAVNTSVAVQVKATRGVTVKNCTATNMHSLIQAQSCDTGDVKVINSTVNGKNGVAFKQVKNAVVEDNTITATGYGIRFDGNTDNYGITVKENTVTAAQPFIVRRMTGANNTITLEGTNTLETEAEYQIVITNGEDDAEYVKPTGTYTLTGADNYTIFPAPFPVASWDEFTAALAAGEDWIKLTADITYTGNYELKKNIILDLGGKSITMPMFYVFSKATIKNGTINGKMYARTGCNVTLEGLTYSGTISDDLSTEGHLQIQGGCDVYAKNCTFAATTVNGSQTRSLSIEESSSGTRKFEGCDFKFLSWGTGAGKYKKNVYINTMSGTTTVDFTNCKLNGKAPNILFAGSYSLTNLTMSGCDNTAPTLETNRAKDAVTEVEWAHISSLIANNKFTKVRLFYAGGSSEYIY